MVYENAIIFLKLVKNDSKKYSITKIFFIKINNFFPKKRLLI